MNDGVELFRSGIGRLRSAARGHAPRASENGYRVSSWGGTHASSSRNPSLSAPPRPQRSSSCGATSSWSRGGIWALIASAQAARRHRRVGQISFFGGVRRAKRIFELTWWTGCSGFELVAERAGLWWSGHRPSGSIPDVNVTKHMYMYMFVVVS